MYVLTLKPIAASSHCVQGVLMNKTMLEPSDKVIKATVLTLARKGMPSPARQSRMKGPKVRCWSSHACRRGLLREKA